MRREIVKGNEFFINMRLQSNVASATLRLLRANSSGIFKEIPTSETSLAPFNADITTGVTLEDNQVGYNVSAENSDKLSAGVYRMQIKSATASSGQTLDGTFVGQHRTFAIVEVHHSQIQDSLTGIKTVVDRTENRVRNIEDQA